MKAARQPEPFLTIETCAECGQDLEHCHGVAILHWDAAAECAEDPGCRLAPEQHLFVVSCREVECACGSPVPGADWEQADWEQAMAS